MRCHSKDHHQTRERTYLSIWLSLCNLTITNLPIRPSRSSASRSRGTGMPHSRENDSLSLLCVSSRAARSPYLTGVEPSSLSSTQSMCKDTYRENNKEYNSRLLLFSKVRTRTTRPLSPVRPNTLVQCRSNHLRRHKWQVGWSWSKEGSSGSSLE